jgi:hypothetical protein
MRTLGSLVLPVNSASGVTLRSASQRNSSRLLVTRSRFGFGRRLIALLVMIGFGSFTAELLIADSCDGDAGGARVGVVSGADQLPGSDGPSPAPAHSVHVCHCVHAHGGLPARIDRVPPAAEQISSVVIFVALKPPTPALELSLRPPIA